MSAASASMTPFSWRGRLVGEGLAIGAAIALGVFALRASDVWLARHMTQLACVSNPRQLGWFHVLRIGSAIAAIGAATLGRAWLGRAFGRWAGLRTAREMTFSVASITTALVLAVVVSDGWLRVRRERDQARVVDNRGVQVTRDERGFRLVHGQPIDTSRPTIVFDGESVAFGWGLPDDATIPALVGARLGMQTRNVAVSGASNEEALLVLRDELPRTPKPRAVVTFVVIDWLHRNLEPRRAHLALDEHGHLALDTSTPAWLGRSVLWEKAHSIYHAADPVDVVRPVLRETAALARAAGAVPLFVITECGEGCMYNGPEGPAVVTRVVDGQDLDWIVVPQERSEWLPNDIHPNRAGAERYAAAIERALRSKGITDDRSLGSR